MTDAPIPLTVLFCDVVGSTSLSERLDPEDLREVLQQYQRSCADVVHGFGGCVAQYVGDGLVAHFGHPAAHKDDPERAVLAGLGILAAMGSLSAALGPDRKLDVRVGIHTGPVLVDDSMTRGPAITPAGEAPDIAARLQSLAGTNQLVVSQATYRLLSGSFVCEPLGAHRLEQTSRPLAVYRVLERNVPTLPLGLVGPRGAPTPEADAERRQLTMMFCDFLGPPGLWEDVRPEVIRRIIGTGQRRCAGIIERYEGHVALFTHEGVVAHFGHPIAHEDDARRAVLAGLAILEETAQRKAAPAGGDLDLRIGVHTGLVVVGRMGSDQEPTIMSVGETPNLAARVRDIAGPSELVVSHATHRLVEGFFVTQPLGPQPLKGISQPVDLYRVVGATGARSRLDVTAASGLAPLFGREREAAWLLGAWQQATDRAASPVVLVSGEAGIGKSRLVASLRDQVEGRWLECQCSPYYRHSPFHPVIELLEARCGFAGSAEDKLQKLESLSVTCGLPLPASVPLLGTLLSIPLGDRYPPSPVPPERRRRQTMEVLVAVLAGLVGGGPDVLVVEDLHSADPSTLELLELLLKRPPPGLVTILTFRPEFEPPWPYRPEWLRINLSRLAPDQVRALAEQVAGCRHLPPQVLDHVVQRTDGIALFVEELTRMVLESGLVALGDGAWQLAGPLTALAIPVTLQDSLMARLDRLSAGRALAQLAATLGREFDVDVLQLVADRPEESVRRDLTVLADAELVEHVPESPATYRFRHALIQEAAYESLLKSTRRRHHQRIATMLEERFPETAEVRPELLAHHYTGAGLADPAIGWWQRAGRRAIELSANVEAVAQLTTARELLETLPESGERSARELNLLVTLAAPLQATRGYSDLEVERVLARARQLCGEVEATPQLAPVLAGLLAFFLIRADLGTAGELGEQLASLGRQLGDGRWVAHGAMTLGFLAFYRGDLARARRHLEEALSECEHGVGSSESMVLHVFDTRLATLRALGPVLWLLGDRDGARQRSREAVALGEELPHSYGLASALGFGAVVDQFEGDLAGVQGQAEAAVTLSDDQGFAFWSTWGRILGGWAQSVDARRSEDEQRRREAVAQIRRGVETYERMGAALWRPYWLALLAEAGGEEGTEESFALVDEALATTRRTGERWWQPELYRLRGELLATAGTGRASEAAHSFRTALDIAHRHGAISLERRAAVSLRRFLDRRAAPTV